MSELQDFIEISKYAGERYDLVQAGGGNSSVKTNDGTMYIKASGVYLSEVCENSGYSIVRNQEILKVFDDENIYKETDKRKRDKKASEYMSECNLTPDNRPSIETLLHALLKKYTLHTHPILVNAVVNRENWKEVLLELFGNDIILVEYKTPGLELATELKKQINGKNPSIIFLQNHGLIITSDIKEEIKNITEYVLEELSKYLDVDMSKYKLTNEVSSLINNGDIAYLSEDEYLNKKISSKYINSVPFCPDKMVYCGVKALILGNNPKQTIKEYRQKYFDIPKVLIYKGYLFFIAKNIKKAKETEDVFKFHIMSLEHNRNDNINYLQDSEIEYLGNWEAEKYRKEL